MVEIGGIVAPTANIEAGANVSTTIFTLPEGYRPSKRVYGICQGSGRNVWLLTIDPNGNVTFGRYGTTEIVAVPTNVWLPFNKMFSVD